MKKDCIELHCLVDTEVVTFVKTDVELSHLRHFGYSLLFASFLLLTACVLNETSKTNEIPSSEQSIRIGVIGQAPDMDEKNVKFTETTLEQWSLTSEEDFQALFIMPEYLEEASAPQYAHLYTSLEYPVFFIGSTKSYYPFTEESLTYSTAPPTHSGMYVTGFINKGGQFTGYEYGLPNDELTEQNLKEVYKIIFQTLISE